MYTSASEQSLGLTSYTANKPNGIEAIPKALQGPFFLALLAGGWGVQFSVLRWLFAQTTRKKGKA